jgi:putative DNA methylase
MPNHVHVLIRLLPDHSLSGIIQKWKGGSSMEINRLLERTGTVWAADYYDRIVRDEDHYYKCRNYIRNNPVKAGLCEKPEDWKFSSAWKERGL